MKTIHSLAVLHGFDFHVRYGGNDIPGMALDGVYWKDRDGQQRTLNEPKAGCNNEHEGLYRSVATSRGFRGPYLTVPMAMLRAEVLLDTLRN